jgi:hypothetical protein
LSVAAPLESHGRAKKSPSGQLEEAEMRLKRILNKGGPDRKPLLKTAQSLGLASRLPTARGLDSYEGSVRLKYTDEFDLVDAVCREDRLGVRKGASPAVATICGDFGVIVAGKGIWFQGDVGNDKALLDERLAWVLAHELGHIMLQHSKQAEGVSLPLAQNWYLREGGLAAELKATELYRPRYQAGPDGKFDPEDEAELSKLVGDDVARAFLDAHQKDLDAFWRGAEDEADLYAQALTKAAGYDPSQGAQVVRAAAGDLVLALFGPAGFAGTDPTHKAPAQRAWEIFMGNQPGLAK